MPQLATRAAGEERELGTPRPALQAPRRHKPSFAPDVAPRSIGSPIDLLKHALHFGIFHFLAERVNPIGREPPIVVIAGTALPLLDMRISETAAGEMLHRVQNGAVKRAVDVDKNSVDIEDNQLGLELHHSSLMALSRRCVCCTVPAVMRTKPSRPNSEARSRTRIPRRASRFTRRDPPGPKSASTKFAPLGKTRAPICSSPRASCERLSKTFSV